MSTVHRCISTNASGYAATLLTASVLITGSSALLVGCASNHTASAPSESASTAAPHAEVLDPITREPIQGEGHAGYYGQWKVLFNSSADAVQYATLPRDKRAKLAAPQVLAAKQITNTTCPITGETLTAAAAPAKYEGEIIGFASVADANQFKSLAKNRQAKVIEKWKASGTT